MIELRKKVSQFNCIVKNFRITEVAIEFDLFVPDQASKDSSIRALETEYGKELSELDLAYDNELVESKEDVVKKSIDLFNEQRYWECHETLEQIWRKETEPAEKALQQGIILAASALVHAQKNEDDVCFGMIPRALEKLDKWNEPSYYSLDTKQLKDVLRRILDTRSIEYFELSRSQSA